MKWVCRPNYRVAPRVGAWIETTYLRGDRRPGKDLSDFSLCSESSDFSQFARPCSGKAYDGTGPRARGPLVRQSERVWTDLNDFWSSSFGSTLLGAIVCRSHAPQTVRAPTCVEGHGNSSLILTGNALIQD